MIDRAAAPILYIDANPFIYAVEGDQALAGPIKELFAFLRQRPGIAITSELTLAEVMPKAGLPRYNRQYLDLIIWSGIFELRPITRSVLLETVRYRRHVATRRSGRSRAMPKLLDSIHIATAIQAKCRYFLSSDRGLKMPTNLRPVEPDSAGVSVLTRKIA